MNGNGNKVLYSEIISFKESGNVMDMVNNTDIIQIKITNDNLDEYIKNILSVNDLNSIILPPKININDIYQDCISINISHDIKDTELNITKYELKFSEQWNNNNSYNNNNNNNNNMDDGEQKQMNGNGKYNTQIIKCNDCVTKYNLGNLKDGTNYVISARLYSSLLSKWSIFCKNIHIKTNKYINYGGRVILKSMNDSNRLFSNISFINCIIHCLSNTKDLRDYFISLKYINDLNNNLNNNKSMEFEGNFANIFGNILINIWSNRYDTISHSLSQLLVNKQFNNDPFKFLVFLLETLHESLNINLQNKLSNINGHNGILNGHSNNGSSIKQKLDPSISWKNYISMNKSKIVDLFQSQYKTDLTCLQCKKHQIKFGVYSYLSLPINKMQRKSFIIDIFHRGYSNYSIDDNGYNNNMNKPVRHIFHCNPNGIIKDLAKIIAKKYKVKRQFVLFYENNKNKVSREYEHKMLIKNVPNHIAFACYILKDWNKEITAEEVKMKKITLWLAKLCHIGPLSNNKDDNNNNSKKINKSNNSLFGMPFVLSFISIHTKQDIYKHVYERLYIWLGIDYLLKPPKISTKQQPQEIENEMKTYEADWKQILHKNLPFRLRLMNNEQFDGYPEEIAINDNVFENLSKSKHIDIIIEWKSHEIYDKVKKVMNKVIVDPEYSKWKKERNDNDNLITLYDCIDSYTSKKRPNGNSNLNGNNGNLNGNGLINIINNAMEDGFPDISQMENNGNHHNHHQNDMMYHYCPRCKKKQKSTKKLDLYSFPKYLIIHLQRDGINGNKFVDVPLEGLNLSKFRVKNKKKSSMDIPSDEMNDDRKIAENDDHSPYGNNGGDDGGGCDYNLNLREAPIYNLYGVATNIMNDCSSYIKNNDNSQWYHYNDSQITLVHQSQVISSSSYILFYKKSS